MQVKYFRGTWGMALLSLEANLQKIKEGEFDGVEMSIPANPNERRVLHRLLDELGLELVAQQYTSGNTPEEHIQSFEQQYRRAAELHPLLVNSHTGKDYYSPAENVRIMHHAEQLENELGIPVLHEIHRGRATFSAPATAALIEAFPTIKLAADFSHWCVVHESFLQDQVEQMELAIRHTQHVHARVGHPEGPQVSDPRAQEWGQALEIHLGWWQQVVDYQKSLDTAVFTITPEFGPPDYMPTLPFTRMPVTDLWDVNLYMRELLKERLKV
jgi:sugar phosphate isomerase/epimerase